MTERNNTLFIEEFLQSYNELSCKVIVLLSYLLSLWNYNPMSK